MTTYSDSINQQYGLQNLSERILAAIENAGLSLAELTQDDLAMMDQLHNGGQEATRKLAAMAGFKAGMKVLDIGSGLGGPARTLCVDLDVEVSGIDLTAEYVAAAQMLTEGMALDGKVKFQQGSALDLPFEDASFDAAITQNALMNIEDKHTVISEAYRVLRPGATLALGVILAGPNPGLQFPCFWADSPEISFLPTPEAFQKTLSAAGFDQVAWEDVTPRPDEAHSKPSTPGAEEPLLKISVVYGNVREKRANTMAGFKDGSIVDIYAVYRKPG